MSATHDNWPDLLADPDRMATLSAIQVRLTVAANREGVIDRLAERCHDVADETGEDAGIIFRVVNCGFGSDPIGGSWSVVPFDRAAPEEWMKAVYVAMPGAR